MTTQSSYVPPPRRPATWKQVFIAAAVTWALTWVAGLLFASDLSYSEEAGWVAADGTVPGYFAIFVTGMMFSGAVSWLPLTLLIPLVRRIDTQTTRAPLIGLGIGAVVGAAFSVLLLPLAVIFWGATLGAMMGAMYFLVLRNVRS